MEDYPLWIVGSAAVVVVGVFFLLIEALTPATEEQALVLAPMLTGFGLVGYGLFVASKAYRISTSESVPADQARVQEGVVEVEGEAQPIDGNTISAKYTDDEVIGHSWRKKELRSRAGESSDTWTVTDKGEEAVPFRVVDDTGEIAVDPEGAGLSFDKEIVENTGKTEKQQGVLEPGDGVHVYGQRRSLTERRDDLGNANVYIGDGDDVPTFRITEGSESRTVRLLYLKGAGLAFFGLLLVAFAGYGFALVSGVV